MLRPARYLLPPTVAVLAGFASVRQAQEPPRLRAVPYHESGIYRLGERVGWSFQLPLDSTGGEYGYVLKRNNAVTIASGTLAFDSGRAVVETRLDEPAMLTLEITPPGGKPALYGAAVAPRGLKPVVPRPKDFDAFWRRKLAELKAVPENPVLTPGESDRENVEYTLIRMDHVAGTHVYGQIARPKEPGRYPAIVQFQWASPPYPLQRSWVTGFAARGFLALNIEPHDVLPTEPPEYYRALPEALKNYAGTGRKSREGSAFVEMALRDVRAVEYLAKRPDWDGRTLVVIGTSMGGQQCFYAAGLCPKVTHLIVNEPAGCDMNAGRHGRRQGYPFFSIDEPETMETARYVDPVNFAPKVKATSLVAMGFVDDVAPPAGIWTAFNLVRGRKEAAPMVDSPHNNMATPEQQRPYEKRAAEWLAALAQGRRVEGP